jgi:hypothetical protein
MKRVIDSSVAFKWVVPETDSAKALLIRDDFCKALVELLTPDVFPIEIGHALTRAERQGRIPVGSAIPLLRDILNTLPDIHASLPILLVPLKYPRSCGSGFTTASMSRWLKAKSANWSRPTTNSSKNSNLISRSSSRWVLFHKATLT